MRRCVDIEVKEWSKIDTQVDRQKKIGSETEEGVDQQTDIQTDAQRQTDIYRRSDTRLVEGREMQRETNTQTQRRIISVYHLQTRKNNSMKTMRKIKRTWMDVW